MKKYAVILTVLALVSGAAVAQSSPEPAQTSGSHEVKVEAQVVPNIAVSGPVDYQNIGQVAAGDQGKIIALIPFRVHANTEAVRLQICATDLYKGNDPASSYIIPLCQDTLPEVVTTEAEAIGQSDNTLPWDLSTPYASHGQTGLCTEAIIFESGQNGTFSIDFSVKVGWQNDDPELPQGYYTGYVKLVADVVVGRVVQTEPGLD